METTNSVEKEEKEQQSSSNNSNEITITTININEWLKTYKLNSLEKLFAENDLKIEELIQYSDDDLYGFCKELGLNVIQKNRLINGIQKTKYQHTSTPALSYVSAPAPSSSPTFTPTSTLTSTLTSTTTSVPAENGLLCATQESNINKLLEDQLLVFQKDIIMKILKDHLNNQDKKNKDTENIASHDDNNNGNNKSNKAQTSSLNTSTAQNEVQKTNNTCDGKKRNYPYVDENKKQHNENKLRKVSVTVGNNVNGNNIFAYANDCKMNSIHENNENNATAKDLIISLLQTAHYFSVFISIYKYCQIHHPEVDRRFKIAKLWNDITHNNTKFEIDQYNCFLKFLEDNNMFTFKFKNLLFRYHKQKLNTFTKFFVDDSLVVDATKFELCKSMCEIFFQNPKNFSNHQCALFLDINKENMNCDDDDMDEDITYVINRIKNCDSFEGSDFFNLSMSQLIGELFPESSTFLSQKMSRMVSIIGQCAKIITTY